jgi:hypothetical protein
MKLLGAILWLLLLVGAYGLGAEAPARTETVSTAGTSFEAALDHRDPLSRSFGISRFLRDLDAQGIGDVVEAVEAAGYWFDQQEHRLLMAAWVPIDPDEAVVWAFSRPGILQGRATETALEALGYSDPPRALHVLQSVEDRDEADFLHLNMVQGWARSDHRDELVEYLASQPRSVYRQRAAAALVNEILKGGPDELIEWVDTIEADPRNAFKRTVFQRAADALSQLDPARAARWLDEHLGRPYAFRSPNLVARHWAEKDPAAAMSWLVSLPKESSEEDRTKSMFAQWLNRDARSAESWVRAEAPSEVVDPLIRVIIRRDFSRRPEVAMEWAHLLHDPVVRTRVQTSAGRSWYRLDRDAFLAWLPDSGLEKQVRDLILNTPIRHELRGADPPEREPTQP